MSPWHYGTQGWQLDAWPILLIVSLQPCNLPQLRCPLWQLWRLFSFIAYFCQCFGCTASMQMLRIPLSALFTKRWTIAAVPFDDLHRVITNNQLLINIVSYWCRCSKLLFSKCKYCWTLSVADNCVLGLFPVVLNLFVYSQCSAIVLPLLCAVTNLCGM